MPGKQAGIFMTRRTQGCYYPSPMNTPAAVQPPEKSFDILQPEAARALGEALLKRQLEAVRSAIEHCLHAVPGLGNSLMTAIDVYGHVYRIPAHPNQVVRAQLYDAIASLIGTSPSGGIQRQQVSDDAIARHPEFFAALYAWGYLYPEEEWNDVINAVPSRQSVTEELNADVLRVFFSFLHGSEESGLHFNIGDRQLCFDTAATGLVMGVIAHCSGESLSNICRLDPGKTAKALLEKYPDLHTLDRDAQGVLEAVVVVCGGRQ